MPTARFVSGEMHTNKYGNSVAFVRNPLFVGGDVLVDGWTVCTDFYGKWEKACVAHTQQLKEQTVITRQGICLPCVLAPTTQTGTRNTCQPGHLLTLRAEA